MENRRISPLLLAGLAAVICFPAILTVVVGLVTRPHARLDWCGLAFFMLLVILLNLRVVARSRRRVAEREVKPTSVSTS